MRTWKSKPEWSDESKAPAAIRIRKGNHGNGNPDRPSKITRRQKRAAARAAK